VVLVGQAVEHDVDLIRSAGVEALQRRDALPAGAARRRVGVDLDADIVARPVEQPVNLDDDDDVFNWPFLYAVRTGEWNLTPAQADKMRDFLNRGGFFMTDDFWGSFEWQVFEQSMRRVYPDREIADIPNSDAIFHGIFDLSDRYQIPGAWGLRGRPYQNDGDTPYWRAIRDDKGRIIAGMIPNSDLGDSWEYADDPYYPERYSALGIRTTINYIAYAMSH